jgi:hypothetical protein
MATGWLDCHRVRTRSVSRIRIAICLLASCVAVEFGLVGAAAAVNPPAYCTIDATDGGLTGLEGILVDGVCRPVGSGGGSGGVQVEYRLVGCTANGRAFLNGALVGSCGAGVPGCKLLLEGGQSGRPFIYAYQYQSRRPGQGWVAESFWCPQTQVPVVVPDAATIRDRVIRLLPQVGIGTAGPSPTTLVNIQTLLWARTGTDRGLGRVVIVGRPVWLKIVFDHGSWDFGDGTSASSAVPGKAYDDAGDPCAQVLCPDYYGHLYRATGAMTITLRVSWRASYSLDGTHFQELAGGPITGPRASTALTVRQARAVLVPNPGD